MAADLTLRFHLERPNMSEKDMRKWAEALADREHLNLYEVKLEHCEEDTSSKHDERR